MTRQHLLDKLSEGLHCKLTLISVPAGFGKTTLVSAWLAEIARPTAWLSLDEADNDLTRFLAYLIAALQTVAATIGDGLVDMLHSPQPPATKSILTTLLNDDISTVPDPLSSSWMTTTLLRPSQLIVPSPSCSSTCPLRCIWSLPHAKIHHSLWPAYALAAS